MRRIRHFLTNTPFPRYAVTALFVLLVGYQGVVWGKRQVREVLVPQAEAYLVDKLLPKVMAQAQKAVEEGIRNGANGALSDVSGGILGSRPEAQAFTRQPGAPNVGSSDPCRVSPFGFPGVLPRLSR